MAGGTSHTPPELMKLGQAEAIRVFDNQGVDIGDIKPGFNNSGADQHLNIPLRHGLHHVAEGILPHLAVSHSDGKTGNPALQSGGALVDGFHPVVQIIYLSAPLHLPADGVVNDGGAVFHDKGLNRITIGGRFFNGGHVPDTGQSHVQRPGNRGRGKSQHIHALGNFLQALLVADAEPLLLVDDQQSQILEGDALLQKLVGAHNQIHGSGPEVLYRSALFGGGTEPAEHIDIHRESPEPGDGGLIMLLGQHRGGHQNGDLLAVHHGFHGGPQGNLRFAEAHVTAEKPIHGGGGFHIPLDIGNAAKLIVGFRIGEIVFKFLLPGGIGGEGEALLPFPGGVKLNQLTGHILGGFSGFRFCFLPGVGADFVQPDVGIFTAASDIFADQIQLSGGNEQGIGALVGDLDIVLDGTVHPDLFHGNKPANAVIVMNHQIAGGQIGEGVQLLPVGGSFFRRPPFRFALGQELTLRQNSQLGIGIFHAEGKGAVGEENLPLFGHGIQRNTEESGQPLGAQHFLQQLRPAAGTAEYQGAEFHFLIVAQIADCGFQITAVAGQLLGGHGQQMLWGAVLRVGGATEGIHI